MVNNIPSLYLGSFNSEHFWRETHITKLPAIADRQADTIVSVMDEMGFVFCKSSKDLVITRFPMNGVHKDYLGDLGFSFSHNELPLVQDRIEEELYQYESIEEQLLKTSNYEYFQKLICPLSELSPYSILPFTEPLCNHYNLPNSHPNIDIVKKVNSKLFSHQLAKQLFENTVGEIVYSAKELATKGDYFLQSSPFLIKDEFGVSGKGNILISSPPILRQIVKHIEKQENTGQETRFLLEPLLDKEIDFSCQFEIESTGKINIHSIQKMLNSGFAFSAIKTAEPSFQEKLDQLGYFAQVKAIAIALYQQGYYGAVCLDSMFLKDGKIVPIVEINARKSMGFINHYVDVFLSRFSTQGCLAFFSLGLSHPVTFKEIIDIMRQENILFLKDKPNGIIPLSSNTLDVNWKLHKKKNYKIYKGRLYASIVSDDEENKAMILSKMNKIFTDLSIQLFN